MKKNILSIVGARPQFIKAAVVSRALRSLGVKESILHSGQHYDLAMSDAFFRELSLPAPDYALGIGSGSHGAQTGRMLEAIEKVLIEKRPGLVIVYGDTNTTLAGALAAAKLQIPVAHVEAGLRSHNKKMPEETNRVLTDHLSTLLFCPTRAAMANLGREGFPLTVSRPKGSRTGPDSPVLCLVGDVMYDLVRQAGEAVGPKSDSILEKFGLRWKDYALVTIHRAENTDDPARLKEIWEALIGHSEGETIVFPLHPRTRKALGSFLQAKSVPRRPNLLPPLGYREMIGLEKGARVVLTDSGGVQKESAFLRTPVIVPRSETEWVELAEAGWVKLIPAERVRIQRELIDASPPRYSRRLFGDGRAGQKIADLVKDFVRGEITC